MGPNVPNSAWTTAGLVNVGGITYPVAENVVCYNRKTGSFTTLGAARAWSGTTNLYYDKTPDQGGKIRVIEVGGAPGKKYFFFQHTVRVQRTVCFFIRFRQLENSALTC